MGVLQAARAYLHKHPVPGAVPALRKRRKSAGTGSSASPGAWLRFRPCKRRRTADQGHRGAVCSAPSGNWKALRENAKKRRRGFRESPRRLCLVRRHPDAGHASAARHLTASKPGWPRRPPTSGLEKARNRPAGQEAIHRRIEAGARDLQGKRPSPEGNRRAAAQSSIAPWKSSKKSAGLHRQHSCQNCR